MSYHKIVVLGASAGGFGVIPQILAGIAPDLPISIFVVCHMAPDAEGYLPKVLEQKTGWRAKNAADGDKIETGMIYVAPPDKHMIINRDHISINRGPKENRFRPAIDPLFRSAALDFREKAIGVILSGALDDGAAGLWSIKAYGGLTVVQDPSDAEVSSMPQAALDAVRVDYCVAASEMGSLITRLVKRPIDCPAEVSFEENAKTTTEINIFLKDELPFKEIMELGKQSKFACPDCHGVLTEIKEGDNTRYRCHTGHAFSSKSLLSAVVDAVEQTTWNAIRSYEESVMLLNYMGDFLSDANQPRLASSYFQKAKTTIEQINYLRQSMINDDVVLT